MTKQNTNEQRGHIQGRHNTEVAPKAESRLSDAALILLGSAAGRGDGLVLPPPASCRARGKALERVLGSLLKTALVKEVSVATDERAWRTDASGNRIGLEITDEGRRAIWLPVVESQRSVGAEQPARKGKSVREPDQTAEGRAAAVSPPVAERRQAAQTSSGSATPEQPRQTKQDRLVSLLSEPEGQSVAVLGDALAWLPHTVRAALTGLRQKGFALTKSKDQTGTTLYRIEAGAGASGPAKAA